MNKYHSTLRDDDRRIAMIEQLRQEVVTLMHDRSSKAIKIR